MVTLQDRFNFSPKAIVCQDADVRGDVTIGPLCILHPKCTVIALSGPIVFGQGNIVEETAVIVNRRTEPMIIGNNNLFEVGCRIEAASVGSHNTFEAKSCVLSSVAISDWCQIGAGCIATPLTTFSKNDTESDTDDLSSIETLPSRTVVFGADCTRRVWSGEGLRQATALHAKHLDYLREMIPRYARLKMITPAAATETS